jgi:hypothetical protein
MATAKSIDTNDYKLFPSPRNVHRVIFEHQVFVPYPYALIVMDEFYFKGRYSLFSACRMSDGKMGQVATFELARTWTSSTRSSCRTEPRYLFLSPSPLGGGQGWGLAAHLH